MSERTYNIIEVIDNAKNYKCPTFSHSENSSEGQGFLRVRMLGGRPFLRYITQGDFWNDIPIKGWRMSNE